MITLIIAIAVVSIIIILLSILLPKEHNALKFFMIMVGFALLILIPKATLDQPCSLVINHTETSGSAPVVEQYYYITQCTNQTSTGTTNLIFYKTYVWFYGLIFVYLFFYLVWSLLNYAGVRLFVGKNRGKK